MGKKRTGIWAMLDEAGELWDSNFDSLRSLREGKMDMAIAKAEGAVVRMKAAKQRYSCFFIQCPVPGSSQ